MRGSSSFLGTVDLARAIEKFLMRAEKDIRAAGHVEAMASNLN